MPFSAAGVLIVLLVVGMVGQAAWARHQRSLSTVDKVSDSALLAFMVEIRGDIKTALKYAVYRALWEVSKRADDYDDVTRMHAIKQLATGYFAERVTELGSWYSKHDSRVELDVPSLNTWPSVNIEEIDGGYMVACGGLPEGSRLRLKSRDNSLSVVTPMENVVTFIDSRYFLLQEQMDEFVKRRGDIATWWGIMEYLTAWGEAWLKGKVHLDDSRSRAFFETAWGIHEFNTFGSADYWTIAEKLAEGVGGSSSKLAWLRERTVMVTPISAVDVDTIREYIDLALSSLEGAAANLEEAKRCIRMAEDMKASSSENTRRMLKNAVDHVADARGEISAVEDHFNQLLEFVESHCSNNVVMDALYQSFTSRSLSEDYPSLKEQIELGTKGVSAELFRLERSIADLVELSKDGAESSFSEISAQTISSIDLILSRSDPERWVTFTVYAGDPPKSTGESIPVYIWDESNGTIGTLKFVLEKAREDLNQMKTLSQQYEPTSAELEVDEELVLRLAGNPPEFETGREEFYELMPPQPIHRSPGVSVFHDFEVKSITYRREDPAGWCGSPTATPVPLWFIGVTLWWGQWEITLELDPNVVEEIFDYDNPTLPRPYGFGHVHKPLAYRWEMPDEPFSIRVVVISLRPFSISS